MRAAITSGNHLQREVKFRFNMPKLITLAICIGAWIAAVYACWSFLNKVHYWG